MKKRVRQKFVTSILFILVAGICAWLLIPRTGLLDHAVRLTDTRDWVGTDPVNIGGIPYFWKNNSDIAFLIREGTYSMRLNFKTVIPVGADTSAISTNITFPLGSVISEPSPDRRFLPYLVVPANPSRAKISHVPMLVSLTNGKLYPMYDDWFLPHCFSADSSTVWSTQWIKRQYCVQARNIESRKTATFPLPPTAAPSPTKPVLSPLFVEPQGLLTSVENGPYFYPRLVKTMGAGPRIKNFANASLIRFTEIDVNRPGLAPRVWTILAPQDALRGRFTFSPQHDRILWVFSYQQELVLDRALQKIIPQHKVRTQKFARWQISQPDGTQRRDIARFEIPQSYSANVPAPQWTPDGRRISFIYKNALYAMPAE